MKPFPRLFAGLHTLSLFALPSSAAAGPARPNILWLISEDNSPYPECHGDEIADTPNLDNLAARAATGCIILNEKAAPAKADLRARLADDSADVQVVAAESIAWLGESQAAVKTVAGVLNSGNPYEGLAAQNTLDYLLQAGHVTLAEAKRLVTGGKSREPLDRIPKYLLGLP